MVSFKTATLYHFIDLASLPNGPAPNVHDLEYFEQISIEFQDHVRLVTLLSSVAAVRTVALFFQWRPQAREVQPV